jgi:HAD superfamily hydrolase (TIGR01490 family)
METNKNLVVFDFCETLVNFQSADKFVNFVLSDKFTLWSFISKQLNAFFSFFRIYSIFNKISPKLNLSKRVVLLGLRGVSEDKMLQAAQAYLNDIVLKNLNVEIMDCLYKHRDNGDLLLLSSGGYQPYLQLFKEKFNFNFLMCSQIEISNEFATGFIKGNDCMHENKVTLLKELIELENLKYNQIITYTDSITDKPLLNFSDIGYVISYNKKRDWVEKNKFIEIIIKNEYY